jgi:hypothetical protein
MIFTLPANLHPENNFASCAIVTYTGAQLTAIAGVSPISLPKNKCILLCNDLTVTLTLRITYGLTNDLTTDVIVTLKGNTNYKMFLPYPVLQIQNEAGVSGADSANLLTIFCFN